MITYKARVAWILGFTPLVLLHLPMCAAQDVASSSSPRAATIVHPTGAVNGSNLIFTLPELPAESVNVRVAEGGRELKAYREFNVNGREITLAPSVVPSPGMAITASYSKGAAASVPAVVPEANDELIKAIERQVILEGLLDEANTKARGTGLGASRPHFASEPRHPSFMDLVKSRIDSGDEPGRHGGEQRLSGFEGLGTVGLTARASGGRGAQDTSRGAAASGEVRSRAFSMMQRRIDTDEETHAAVKKGKR